MSSYLALFLLTIISCGLVHGMSIADKQYDDLDNMFEELLGEIKELEENRIDTQFEVKRGSNGFGKRMLDGFDQESSNKQNYLPSFEYWQNQLESKRGNNGFGK